MSELKHIPVGWSPEPEVDPWEVGLAECNTVEEVRAFLDRPDGALPEDAILVPTEGMTPEQLDGAADQMAAALLPKVNEWRLKNGFAPSH